MPRASRAGYRLREGLVLVDRLVKSGAGMEGRRTFVNNLDGKDGLPVSGREPESLRPTAQARRMSLRTRS